MKVDIYVTNDYKGVVVPAGTDIATLPQNVFELAKYAISKKQELDTGDNYIGLDMNAALAGIEEVGYYVAAPKIVLKEQQ